MAIICDTHVHVYPCYDAANLLEQLVANLAIASPGASPVALLTEGRQHDVFADWSRDASALKQSGISCKRGPDRTCLVLRADHWEQPLYLFAGRQIVTEERVEILSLACESRIPDGKAAVPTVNRVLESGGVPVVSWAPGKWFPPRHGVVREILHHFGPGDVLLGDTSLRATAWPTPVLMARAQRRGFRILAGSDPLPFAGEERQAGRYATALSGNMDTECPTPSIRCLLRGGAGLAAAGRRVSAVGMLRRLWGNARVR